MASPSRHGSHGFTLLELVLAMTALALISAICYGAFHVAIRAMERGEVAVVTAQRLRVVTDLLIRQVKSAVATVPAGQHPETEEDEDPDFAESCPYFVGGPHYLSFLTAAGMRGGGGLSIATYRIVPDPPRLVFEETPWPGELPTEEQHGTMSAVVLEGFEEAGFAFLPPEPEEPWQSRWDGCDDTLDFVSLPAAVRFTVRNLPGLEVEEWSQEIPSMLASFSLENVDADGF
jgi:prepilin-type N-terminal cleavage/methylation domain-containing protein